MKKEVAIIECPRDAMQGLKNFIPTEFKKDYLGKLLAVGFDTIDIGSLVSPKAVPQMKDTKEVLAGLDMTVAKSKLLVIVANVRGAQEGCGIENIDYLGFPLSVSETFQQHNSNKSIVQSLEDLMVIQELCTKSNKELVVYLSMGFGNPYGDPYSADIVAKFADILISLGVNIISIADTVGQATPEEISDVYKTVSGLNESVEWGLHLHASPIDSTKKVAAALTAGCRRIDGAILGFGGCPFAKDELVGNINTRNIISAADELGLIHNINLQAFDQAEAMANTIFN